MTFRSLFPLASLLLTLPALASNEDESTRKKLIECINKDIVMANAEWKLPAGDLKKFTDIIDREIMKEPLVKKTAEGQARIADEIQEAAHKELPSLKDPTLQKMMQTLKAKGMHCATLMKAKARGP